MRNLNVHADQTLKPLVGTGEKTKTSAKTKTAHEIAENINNFKKNVELMFDLFEKVYSYQTSNDSLGKWIQGFKISFTHTKKVMT